MQNNPSIFLNLFNPLNSRIRAITVSAANGIFKQYYAQASIQNEILKGFAVTKDQLSAMNAISLQRSSLIGFRVYMAQSSTGFKKIVVGILPDGADSLTTTIYETESVEISSGPCPDVCDAESPITIALL